MVICDHNQGRGTNPEIKMEVAKMRRFTREGIMGCVVLALKGSENELHLKREQTQDILDLLAGELDTVSNNDAETALADFYPDNL